MEAAIFPLTSLPGIQRDGTSFSSQYYRNGQHCRWDASPEKGKGLPRKMGGYRQIITVPEIPRGILVVPSGIVTSTFKIYIGTPNHLYVFTMDKFGVAVSPLTDITPVGFAGNVNNIWQFSVMYSTTFSNTTIIAQAAPNLESIFHPQETPVYYGSLDSVDPFIPIGGGTDVSGGIVVLHPFLFIFGNDGTIQWSVPNDPSNFPSPNINRAAGLKIVAGMPARGGNSSPSGIFWALDSVIRVTFVGEPGVFKFDTITSESSILSSSSIVEDNGIIYWIGEKKFSLYNGTVQELPNNMNRQYFFRNLNYAQRQKVWATKVPQFGEIWWFYPSGINTECDRAVIFNTRLNTWYDTSLDRVSGYFAQVFRDPIWASSNPNEEGEYIIWQQEVGVDQNIDDVRTPIESYFESGDIAWCAIGPPGDWVGKDKWVNLERIEPDFIQTGDLSLIVAGRQYARSLPVAGAYNPYIFTSTTEKIDMREQRREMTLTFRSNEIGGFYYMGNTLLHFRLGDTRS